MAIISSSGNGCLRAAEAVSASSTNMNDPSVCAMDSVAPAAWQMMPSGAPHRRVSFARLKRRDDGTAGALDEGQRACFAVVVVARPPEVTGLEERDIEEVTIIVLLLLKDRITKIEDCRFPLTSSTSLFSTAAAAATLESSV